jgi:hypothetical protein
LFHYDKTIDDFFRPAKSESRFVKRRVSSCIRTRQQLQLWNHRLLRTWVDGLPLTGKFLNTAMMASQAMITSGVWVRLVKYATSRERPQASYTGERATPAGYGMASSKKLIRMSGAEKMFLTLMLSLPVIRQRHSPSPPYLQWSMLM